MAAVKYHLSKFPPDNLDWQRLLPLIGPANAAVARYEATLHAIPNADVLLSPLASQEAVLSSKIEGTRATLGEVLEFEADKKPVHGEKRDDIIEILNYRKALKSSVDSLKSLPISGRLIKKAHKTLMQGARGKNKTPGEYRKIQNWIGPPGSTIETARFVPPEPARMVELIGNWESYLNGVELDKLVQLAIVHAEFEAIHPFLDGNGRLGRLLIPIFMVEANLLSSPDFYISSYFELNRDEYYDRLLAVSNSDDWTGWCEFFLKALLSQAKLNETKAQAILGLYDAKKDFLVEKVRSIYTIRALDWIFKNPIFRLADFVTSVDIPKATATRIIKIFRNENLLIEIRPGGGRRSVILAFSELLNIAEGKNTFK